MKKWHIQYRRYFHNIVLVAITVAVAIIFLVPAAWSQKTSFSAYHQPEKLDLYDTNPQADTGMTCVGCMYTEFYPIGWSRQGEFAYFTFFDDYDASGMAWLNLYIFDAKKDTIAAQLAPEKDYWTETPVDTIWQENKKLFTRLLDSFKIVQQKVELLKFPLETVVHGEKDDTMHYAWRADTDWVEPDSSPYGFPCYDSLVIKLFTNKGGFEKVIYSQFGDYVAIGFSIPGYFQDPFDPYVYLVPLVLWHRGWEGPPNTMSITPIGVVLE